MVNLHLPFPIPVAFAASISSRTISLVSNPPASCPHVAAGNTLPEKSILVLREIFAKDRALDVLGLVFMSLAWADLDGLVLPAVYRIPRSLAVVSTSYFIPFCFRVSLICKASLGVEAIIDPAPFLEESVSRSLVIRSLKCIAAVKILQKSVFASLSEENCAVPSTWTLVTVAGWLWASTSLTDCSRRLRVIATEWAHPARMLL